MTNKDRLVTTYNHIKKNQLVQPILHQSFRCYSRKNFVSPAIYFKHSEDNPNTLPVVYFAVAVFV